MTAAPLRPEVEWREIPAPSHMAPSTWAATAEIVMDDEELASGRLVILHDPAGQEAWDGTWRMVALVQARLEPEFLCVPLPRASSGCFGLDGRRASHAPRALITLGSPFALLTPPAFLSLFQHVPVPHKPPCAHLHDSPA